MSRRRKGHDCEITVLVLLLIFILVGGGLGVLSAKRYMPSDKLADKSRIFGIKDGQVALILDNRAQGEKGIYEGGQVYLPMNWVNKRLNWCFYWDEGEKLLVYALSDSIVYMGESVQGKKGSLFKVTQDGTYLSLGTMVSCTDIRTQVFATNQIERVFVDTSQQPCGMVVLKKIRQVRVRGGVKNRIITEAATGETMGILETMEKWPRVRTSDGYIGHVENRKLGVGEQVVPVSTFEASVYTSISVGKEVRLGFHQVIRPKGNNTFGSYVSSVRRMDMIVPTWFNVVFGDGTYTSLASRDYVDEVHDMGLKAWAMVESVSTEESVENLNAKALMSSISTRKKLIEKLMNEAGIYGSDGFNLDFEGLRVGAGPHYVQPIRKMSAACRNKGFTLSVDNCVPSSYTASYNKKEQGIVVNYVAVMGYDGHYAGGETGSASSIPYVREGTESTLKEVPKEKVINTALFYTRAWTVNKGKTPSKVCGIPGARQWVEENQVGFSWDKLLE